MEPVCVKVSVLLRKDFPHLIDCPCQPHGMHHLINDLCTKTELADVFDGCHTIASFVTGDKFLKRRLLETCTTLENPCSHKLTLPPEHRFGYKVDEAESVFNAYRGLQVMFNTPVVIEKYNTNATFKDCQAILAMKVRA